MKKHFSHESDLIALLDALKYMGHDVPMLKNVVKLLFNSMEEAIQTIYICGTLLGGKFNITYSDTELQHDGKSVVSMTCELEHDSISLMPINFYFFTP